LLMGSASASWSSFWRSPTLRPLSPLPCGPVSLCPPLVQVEHPQVQANKGGSRSAAHRARREHPPGGSLVEPILSSLPSGVLPLCFLPYACLCFCRWSTSRCRRATEAAAAQHTALGERISQLEALLAEANARVQARVRKWRLSKQNGRSYRMGWRRGGRRRPRWRVCGRPFPRN